MKTITFAIFVVVALAQWYLPVTMIRESEQTVTDGEELLFLTRPVDPSDPFRGKYITLTFTEENQRLDTVPQFFAEQELFASFTLDSAGFADLVDLHEEDPGDEWPWVIKVKVSSSYTYDSMQTVTLKFPFDRFYLEESKASDAEKAYWESNMATETETQCYAVVKVKERRAVLVDVRIEGKSIVDIVTEMNKSEE